MYTLWMLMTYINTQSMSMSQFFRYNSMNFYRVRRKVFIITQREIFLCHWWNFILFVELINVQLISHDWGNCAWNISLICLILMRMHHTTCGWFVFISVNWRNLICMLVYCDSCDVKMKIYFMNIQEFT